MPDIIPNTRVMMCKNVPFDDTYSDTINFQSVSAQSSFFASKAKYTYDAFSYQRVNSSVTPDRPKNTIRIPVVADSVYDCNYLAFKNENFGNKWFYAFIKQINYINPQNTEVVYEIDHYQSWLFDFKVLPSYVEREHASSDLPAVQTAPEPIDVDYYVVKQRLQYFEKTNFINMGVTYSEKLPSKFLAGGVGSNIYSGLWYYSSSNADDISSTIKELDTLGLGSSIVSIFMSPTPVNQNVEASSLITSVQKESNILAKNYVAKNKKMCNYPYRVVRMVTTDGKQMDLKPQLFLNDSLQITRHLTVNETPVIGFTPAYDNIGDNFQMGVEYTECPQCAWGSSVYANWAAQNMTGNFIKLTGSLLSVAGGAATGNALAMGAGVLGIASTFGEAMQKQAQPDIPKGQSSSYAMNYNLQRLGLEVIEYVPNYDCCKRIDDYFSMYGYSLGTVKVPDMTSRASWNYVKTRNVIITGSIPVDSMTKIKQMFNDGVRFWHGDFVGNYAMDNSAKGSE